MHDNHAGGGAVGRRRRLERCAGASDGSPWRARGGLGPGGWRVRAWLAASPGWARLRSDSACRLPGWRVSAPPGRCRATRPTRTASPSTAIGSRSPAGRRLQWPSPGRCEDGEDGGACARHPYNFVCACGDAEWVSHGQGWRSGVGLQIPPHIKGLRQGMEAVLLQVPLCDMNE